MYQYLRLFQKITQHKAYNIGIARKLKEFDI